MTATRGANLDLDAGDGYFEVRTVTEDAILVRMLGDWGAETGGSGFFRVEKSLQPSDGGEPVDYDKETNFDSHYHDCDEYRIF